MGLNCITHILLLLLATLITTVLCGRKSGVILTRKAFLPRNIEATESALVSQMTVACMTQGIEVSFVRENLLSLGVVDPAQLHLADSGCDSVVNVTHYTLHTDFLGCNTSIEVSPTNTTVVLKNKVVISPPVMYPGTNAEIIDDDLCRPIEIEFSCTYSKDKSSKVSKLPPSIQMASIKLYNTDSFTLEVDLRSNIARGTSLYAKVNAFDAANGKELDFLINSCYLSSRPDTAATAISHYLINNGCPVDDDVHFIGDNRQHYSTRKFLFRAKRFNRNKPIYLHCTLSACHGEEEYQCKSQQEFCSERNELLEPPFHKVLLQGLRVVKRYTTTTTTTTTTKRPKTPAVEILDPMPNDQPSQCQPVGPPDPCKCPTMLDTDVQSSDIRSEESRTNMVSIEMTVIVGIISFLIGAGLTGVLWCVYIKTDPRRKMQAVAMSEDGPSSSSQESTIPTVKILRQTKDMTSSDEFS